MLSVTTSKATTKTLTTITTTTTTSTILTTTTTTKEPQYNWVVTSSQLAQLYYKTAHELESRLGSDKTKCRDSRKKLVYLDYQMRKGMHRNLLFL